jgi:hypothetical protein
MEITIECPRWFLWWKPPKKRTFKGDGTVWHDVETGKRPGTMIESHLSDLSWYRKQQEKHLSELRVSLGEGSTAEAGGPNFRVCSRCGNIDAVP